MMSTVIGRFLSCFAYFLLIHRSKSRTVSAVRPRSCPLSLKYNDRLYGASTRIVRRSSIPSKSPVHVFTWVEN